MEALRKVADGVAAGGEVAEAGAVGVVAVDEVVDEVAPKRTGARVTKKKSLLKELE